MRALAQRLGTYPATVYWHVGNRNEVLSAVLEVVFDEIELPDPAEVQWDEWLPRLARDYRAVMHQHRDLAAWVATHPYGRVTAPRMTEMILSVLEHAGFRDARLASAFNAYVGSMVGWVATELIRADGDQGDDWERRYEQEVRSLSRDDYPTIANNIDELADAVFSFAVARRSRSTARCVLRFHARNLARCGCGPCSAELHLDVNLRPV